MIPSITAKQCERGLAPFNFPAMIPLWMFPMAIACGNTFVLKPSEQDPLSTLMLVELALEAGVPPGVLNVVHGGKDVVDALCTHTDIKAVSFVGSTAVGTHVYDFASKPAPTFFTAFHVFACVIAERFVIHIRHTFP